MVPDEAARISQSPHEFTQISDQPTAETKELPAAPLIHAGNQHNGVNLPLSFRAQRRLDGRQRYTLRDS